MSDLPGTTSDRHEELAASIVLTSTVALSLDYQELNDVAARLRADVRRYEAVGIMDGVAYIKKLDDKKARLERLEALLNFVKVSRDTNSRILREGL